jgi:hypothetical protein
LWWWLLWNVACARVVNSNSDASVRAGAADLCEQIVELANEKIDFVSQEMASSSSENNCISLSTLLEWYKIRDTFFGHNDVSQNIPLSIELASSCQHPDARWFTEACGGKDVTAKENAKRIFLLLAKTTLARCVARGLVATDAI